MKAYRPLNKEQRRQQHERTQVWLTKKFFQEHGPKILSDEVARVLSNPITEVSD